MKEHTQVISPAAISGELFNANRAGGFEKMAAQEFFEPGRVELFPCSYRG